MKTAQSSSAPAAIRLLALCVLSAALGAEARAATIGCPAATTLESLVDCFTDSIPGRDSDIFVVPTDAERAAWRQSALQMLAGDCDFALPAALAGAAALGEFVDSSNGHAYCVLREVTDADADGKVDRGWGMFVVDPSARRELSHQAPHPLYDSTTEAQAVALFKGTSSRSFLMAGAHRAASLTASSCQSAPTVSDPAHNRRTMFQATVEAMLEHDADAAWNVVQWHGMSATSCEGVEVYLSHGRTISPVSSDKIRQLQLALASAHPSWQVDVPGNGSCTLDATTNVQGRLLNGVAATQVCGTAAGDYSGRFVHIEQAPGFRGAGDWAATIRAVWPAVPAAPGSPTAMAGDAQVRLAWNPADEADSYAVLRSEVAGGPYQTVERGLEQTDFMDHGVTNGRTYHYVITARNTTGESATSQSVAATPVGETADAGLDAGSTIDAGSAADAGSNADGGSSPDAGVDASAPPPADCESTALEASGGCGCSAAGAGSWLGLMLVIPLALARRCPSPASRP